MDTLFSFGGECKFSLIVEYTGPDGETDKRENTFSMKRTALSLTDALVLNAIRNDIRSLCEAHHVSVNGGEFVREYAGQVKVRRTEKMLFISNEAEHKDHTPLSVLTEEYPSEKGTIKLTASVAMR